MEVLTVPEVLLLHARLIQRTGGTAGVRDVGLLESALARPQATCDGQALYPALWRKAAALLESLIRNHPFLDGNKRAALVATGLFLERNGHALAASNGGVLTFTRRAARGEWTQEEMAGWLEAHSRVVEE